MDPALWELLESSEVSGDEEVECIIRLDRPDVDVAGVRLVACFGHVATCRVRRDDVLPVRRHPNVLSLKASRPLQPEPEPLGEVDVPPGTELPLRVVPGDERRPPGLTATGRGVLVGFVDTGLDFDHPGLKGPDGHTRVVALWDQRDAGTGPAPAPYGYGHVHDRRAIDAALRTPEPYETLGYHPADADHTGRGAHGQHVCDIAVGNGGGGGLVGLAPEADIAFVHLAQKGTGGLANLGDSCRLLEAFHWLFCLAGDRPCVINCSLGRHGGPKDGCTLAEMALDEMLAGTTGRGVVLSGGNYFAKPIHARHQLGRGDTAILRMVVDEEDHTGNELEVWYGGNDELAVQVESPTGETSGWVALGERLDLEEDGRVVGRIYHRECDPNNCDNQVDMFLYPSAPAGPWRVTLLARRVGGDGVVHAWIERDQACEPCQALFPTAESDPRYTVGTIATGHLPLVVGAYDAHDPDRPMAPFSSSGPTRDGRCKPDVAARGYQILAARSAPAGTTRSAGLQVRKSGTSMAAPTVTGAVALCLSVAPRPLGMREIRALVLGTATAPPVGSEACLRLGHGYLDVDRLVAAARATPGERSATGARHDPKGFDMTSWMSSDDLEDELTASELSLWRPFVQVQITAGLRDRDDLTNLVFFARHPQREGRPLRRDEPDFGPLSREWLQIRDAVVVPALGGAAVTPPATGTAAPAPAASPATARPFAVVATPLPWGSTKRRYGVPETIQALDRIRDRWTKRHDDAKATLVVRDISQRGGGRIQSKHKSHRIGLDVDLYLLIEGKPLDWKAAGYRERQRPLVLELVDLIRGNGILPVKAIGFLDDTIPGVSPWTGHGRHLHVRFCMPAHHVAALPLDVAYAGEKARADYTCRDTGTADADSVVDVDDLDQEPDEEAYLDALDDGADPSPCGCGSAGPATETQGDDEAGPFGLPFRGAGIQPGPAVAVIAPKPTPERVVFLPGVLGTTLLDGSLTPAEAARLCRENLGVVRGNLLKGTEFYPCEPPERRPEALWGEIGMLHWLYAPKAWAKRIKSGDGRREPGNVRPGRLLEIDIDSALKRVEVKPYAAFLKALRAEGLDVLEFPYDWRLSAYGLLPRLNKAIVDRWFDGRYPPAERTLAPGERVTIVGHSLGGLLARTFVEDYHGDRLAKRVITIGTPQQGAPLAYLHLAGRMLPFGESPLSRALRTLFQTLVDVNLPAAGAAARALLPAQELVPRDVQVAVVRYMASSFELLPVYDFVETRSGKEAFKDSYKSLIHGGTGTPAFEMVQDFRTLLRSPDVLDTWLDEPGRKVDYHFVATSGFSTVSGYHRGRDEVLTTKDGDGTVPLVSAHPLKGSGRRVTQKLLPKGRLGHQSLCERADVLAYVLEQIGRPAVRAATLQRELSIDELVEATDKILRLAEEANESLKDRKVGIVLSVTALEAQPGDTTLLVDPTTEPTKNGRRLVNPPAHLLSSDVYTIATDRSSLDYVWLQAKKSGWPMGGVLFLPQPDERKVHLVTFNAGPLAVIRREQCTNAHHAEIQLQDFLLAQKPAWRRRLAKLDVVNRSRPRKPGGNRGYSPCCACCDDIQDLPGKLGDPTRKEPFAATLSWREVYKGGAICGHPTTSHCLGLLVAGTWKVDPDSSRSSRDRSVQPALRSPAKRGPGPGNLAPGDVDEAVGPIAIPSSLEPKDWPGHAAEETAFMRAVYFKHRRNARGDFVMDLPESALGDVEGFKARKDAAAAMKKLLEDAQTALGVTHPGVRIGIVSAYRSASRQLEIWKGRDPSGRDSGSGFPHYYREAIRRGIVRAGDLSDSAAAKVARFLGGYIASPGYSNHQDGLAFDLGIAAGKDPLGKLSDRSAFWKWLDTYAKGNPHRFYPLATEPWHWVYRPPGGATDARASGAMAGASTATTAVGANRIEVPTVPLLARHRGTRPDLILRWNVSSVPEEIDVAVHLHGFWYAGMRLPRDIEPVSGLDLTPVGGAAGAGRARPTLTVLPRGHDTGVKQKNGSYNVYTFPALTTKDGLTKLIQFSLEHFASLYGASPPRLGRLILTAHSGGGRALLDILRFHDPHQVHVFDALYWTPDSLVAWARQRIRRDRESPTGDGGLRVFYQGRYQGGTRPNSLAVSRALAGELSAEVARRYRVEASTYDHFQIPKRYGWRVLADVAADVPDAYVEPAGAREAEVYETAAFEDVDLQGAAGEDFTYLGEGTATGEADEAVEDVDLLGEAWDAEFEDIEGVDLTDIGEAWDAEFEDTATNGFDGTEQAFEGEFGDIGAEDEGIEAPEVEAGEAEALLGRFAGEGLTLDEQTPATVTFPGGATLSIVTGATESGEEHFDPYRTGNPLLDTRSDARSQRLSRNFTVGELARSGGHTFERARIDPELVRCLQQLRDHTGKPVQVTSGYRPYGYNVDLYTKTYNKKPTLSRHSSGQAADVRIGGLTGMAIAKAAMEAYGTTIGIGVADGYAHIDVRGTWARWTYFTDKARNERAIAELDGYRQQRVAGGAGPAGTSTPVLSAPPPAVRLRRVKDRGYAAYGGGRLIDALRRLGLGITERDLDTLQRIADVESSGLANAVNSWDSAIMSAAFKQWTLRWGELQDLIGRAPAAFARHGIRLAPSLTYTFRSKGGKPKVVPAIDAVPDPQALRSEDWARRFYLAALEPEALAAAARKALEDIAGLEQTVRTKYGWSPHLDSPRGRALLAELHNNRPAYVKAVVQQTLALARERPDMDENGFLGLLTSQIVAVYEGNEKDAEKGRRWTDKIMRS